MRQLGREQSMEGAWSMEGGRKYMEDERGLGGGGKIEIEQCVQCIMYNVRCTLSS